MINILHIIDSLSGAGPTRSLLSLVKYADKLDLAQKHRVITLQPDTYPLTLFQAKRAGLTLFKDPVDEVLINQIKKADIVQLHYWNNPVFAEFLRKKLPPMRLLIWFKIFGEHPPQVITKELLNFVDFVLTSSPLSLNLPVFTSRSKKWLCDKTGFIYGLADWSRLENLQPQSHENFNVGYIGTVNFTKMHPKYVSMSAGISVPDIKFIVCGAPAGNNLKKRASEIRAGQKFAFRGYVENLKPVLETMDVFGYPLCEDTYATSEKSIQEAMYAGVPPVVFPHGGCPDLVEHKETGLIVNNEAEYQQAIEYLYHHPETRKQLGQNAAAYARRVFDSEKATREMHQVYKRMMNSPKRQRSWNGPANSRSSPAHLFYETLGHRGKPFKKSLTATKAETFLEAEAEISKSSPLLAGGEGGINQFRNYYPRDPYLRLWAGLILQENGRHQKAIKEFNAAYDLGLRHWRIDWYKAQSSFQIQQFEKARKSLKMVVDAAPDFKKASEMLGRIPGR